MASRFGGSNFWLTASGSRVSKRARARRAKARRARARPRSLMLLRRLFRHFRLQPQTLVPQQIVTGRSPWRIGAVLSSNRSIVKAGLLGRGSLCCCERRRRVKRPPLCSAASQRLLSTSVPVPFAPSQTLQPSPNDKARSLEPIGAGRQVTGRLENSRLREHHAARVKTL